MSAQPACGPFTEGYLSGEVSGPLEMEGLVRYRDENCLGARPKRERAREEVADYVLAMLGAPMVRIELDQQQLTIAVDEAFKRYEDGAPRSDYSYFYFNTVPGVNRYKLPCDIGIIRQVYFRAGAECSGGVSADINIDGSIIPFAGSVLFNNMGLGLGVGWEGSGSFGSRVMPMHVNVGEWHLLQSYQELFLRMSSREPTWETGGDGTIIIYPTPLGNRSVAVHYLQRKKDWGDVDQWVKKMALALAKEMLGRVRSKFDRYVSPGGGITLDGQALLQEGRDDQKLLNQELLDKYSIDHMLPFVG